MEHRASTVIFACCLWLAPWLFPMSGWMRPVHCVGFSSMSASGALVSSFPAGFHSSACLVMLEGSLRRVWPTHRHFHLLIWMIIGSCFALVHKNHLRWRICRRHLLTKVWIFLEMLAVTFQVSEPYSNTALIF